MKNEIYIRPYVDPKAVREETDLGTGKYGHVLFEGMSQRETLAYVEDFPGVKRWKNGLNEEAPEVLSLDDEKRQAKIADIRKNVALLEKRLGGRTVDPTDPDFWNKVKLVRNDNHEFWGKVMVMVSNEPERLNLNDPNHLIQMWSIEAGGFDLIAPSLEHIKNSNRAYSWYLDKTEESAVTKTSLFKLRDEAGEELRKVYKKDRTKLVYILKVIAPDSTRYINTTSIDILYEDASRRLEGEFGEKNKEKAITEFLKVCKYPMEDLKIRAVIADARKLRYIDGKPDGQIYFMESGTAMGRDTEEIVLYLKNPVNQDIWVKLLTAVENFWAGNV